jgi:hypothetical protein
MMRRNFEGLDRRLRFMPQGPSLAGGRHDHIARANTTPYLSTDAVRKCDRSRVPPIGSRSTAALGRLQDKDIPRRVEFNFPAGAELGSMDESPEAGTLGPSISLGKCKTHFQLCPISGYYLSHFEIQHASLFQDQATKLADVHIRFRPFHQ